MERATDIFFEIEASVEGEYKEKGSKFLAFAYKVFSVEEAKACLEGLKKEFYDARHHCFAYIIGQDSEIQRASDDGEPSGSAGLPILNQIKSFELTNVLVVVVRYFGGTKLGVSGLVNAYKVSTKDALEKAEVQECFKTKKLGLVFDYVDMNKVQRVMKDHDIQPVHQVLELDCTYEFDIRLTAYERIFKEFEEIYTLKKIYSDEDE